MSEHNLTTQAEMIATLLPRILRVLFMLDDNDPTIELPVAQVRVCTLLREGPQPMTTLSKELGISLSAITQIADRLERAGLVERVVEGEDRRVKLLKLTLRAEEMLSARKKRRIARVQQVLSHIPDEQRAAILLTLGTLYDAGKLTVPETIGDLQLQEL